MILGEPIYLACLVPVVAATYVVPGGRPRQFFLLAVSYAYYLTFGVIFFAILLSITCLAYCGALLLERVAQTRHAGTLLTVLLAASLLPLAFFKYLEPLFVTGTGLAGASWQLSMAQLVLPIGLSFYTFAAIGYLIDVHLGVVAPAERNPLRVALFTGMFPYVTAGPIPRTLQIMPQLELRSRFDADRAMQGVREILVGVIMKFWIADSLTVPAATVYSNLAGSIPLEKLVATVFFAFQLYTDFAGYSLIAIGSARLLGVDVPDNFRQPYLSQSLAEFWRRWHISLVGWMRDYVFYPISMRWRRHPRIAVPAAMFLTLVLIGIWHGCGWGFLAFGALHGLLLAIATITKGSRERLHRQFAVEPLILVPIRVLITFAIVALSLVLIRAQTLTQALAVYHDIFSIALLKNVQHVLGGAPDTFTYIHLHDNVTNIALIVLVVAGDIFARTQMQLARLPSLAQGILYAASVLTVLYQVIAADAPRPFVYFQF
jgi:alginate O-acetyltransferase complex protein AlgI